ncbi:uncharacterized protein LALA0_S05e05798g [Lachancea lanzarotensis]|uniref:LALA0S05e05798g1_1 n=1 Tax=Lachancea lanzarotensis TaxID=1245769 RepID=A0A0C7MXN4_9SACH|nr:uncharacterized protein LALA0_S05e05798g [Lachancea lanzarotensis]CEP62444.1 LALA0S05e05798g1_1 [Lachancea lanzarotensis]
MRESRHQKFVWTIRHDCALVDSVLALGDMLADPIRSYPRTKFWASVSDELHAAHNLARNSRQCRDRFNLLFSRALLVPVELRRSPPLSSSIPLSSTSQTTTTTTGPMSRVPVYDESSEADSPIPSEVVLESRLQMCVRRFRFGNGRSLELNNNSNNSSNSSINTANAIDRISTVPGLATTATSNAPLLDSPPPPPRTGALHELIHPPDSPTQTPVTRPEARFADLALIHSQLHHVHAVLGTLTTDVAQLKAQVAQLQQCLPSRDSGGSVENKSRGGAKQE